MAEESYREFICSSIGIGPRCGFEIRAKTDEEVMEHAKMHAMSAHGMKETPSEMEKKIRQNIKPVRVEVK